MDSSCYVAFEFGASLRGLLGTFDGSTSSSSFDSRLLHVPFLQGSCQDWSWASILQVQPNSPLRPQSSLEPRAFFQLPTIILISSALFWWNWFHLPEPGSIFFFFRNRHQLFLVWILRLFFSQVFYYSAHDVPCHRVEHVQVTRHFCICILFPHRMKQLLPLPLPPPAPAPPPPSSSECLINSKITISYEIQGQWDLVSHSVIAASTLPSWMPWITPVTGNWADQATEDCADSTKALKNSHTLYPALGVFLSLLILCSLWSQKPTNYSVHIILSLEWTPPHLIAHVWSHPFF